MIEISKEDELEIIRLYNIEKYTLRRIAKKIGTNHHCIRRILEKNDVPITSAKGRKQIPMSEETKIKISLAKNGKSYGVGKKMSKTSLYKNMKNHLRFNVEMDFLQQFDNVEKLKILNRIIRNTRLPDDFTDEDYKNYIKTFYYDEGFNNTYNNWIKEEKKKFAKPSIDHITPLSKGGTWDLDNLQIVPWCINRAKFNYSIEEWKHILQHYFINGSVFYRKKINANK